MALCWIGYSIPTMAQQQPNVLLIMADDIGLGDIGFYHTERTGTKPLVPTPNMDKLIREGMRFGDAHSPASLCAPTRFSMLTGNFSYRNYLPWGVWAPTRDAGIDPTFTTIARIAKKGGYTTAFFGKWGLGGLWKGLPENYATLEGGAQKLGFDYSLLLPQGIQNKPYAFYEHEKWMKLQNDSKLVQIPFEQTKYGEEDRNRKREGIGDSNWDPVLAGPLLANKAVEYIQEQGKTPTPFFLYYCSQAVHVPHTPSAQLDGMRIAGSTLGNHGDMIRELDAQVGMIVKALKKTGQYKNSLIVFTSDNGGLNRDKALRDAGHDSSNGLTGKKASIYEGGHRVPFVAVWPGKIEAGSESQVTIVGQDMVATLAAIAGVALDQDKVFDSADLSSVFTQNSIAPLHRYLLHQSQAPGGPYYALREGDWKLVMKTDSREHFESLTPIGLFNFKNKSSESDADNLLHQSAHAVRIAQMKETFLKLRSGGATTTY
ncbi:MAG: arylsulfatase [Bacteroidota bacterium]